MKSPTARDQGECPDRDTLIRFSLGELPPAELEDLTGHVLLCPGCCAVLDDVQNSPDAEGLLAAIRSSFRQPSLPEADAYGRLAAAAADLGAEAPTLGQAVPEADEKPFVPRPVGPYLLVGRVGEGGMGVVYRARHLTLDRDVAVKMILAGPYAGPQALARFRTEARAIARLKHPHVVEIYDFDEQDGQPYFAMELVEGGSLADRLKRGPLPPREAAQVVRAVAEAIHVAHQKGVLHRDLKPANVLLAPDGVPKVSDFGLAKVVDADLTPTLSGLALGTPSYMAPEQVEGRTHDVGPATDVYGLGAVLYAALTGRPPFPGEAVKEVYEQVCRVVPDSPIRHCPALSPPLAEVCLKCLEKSPARRYRSAQALADDLGRWLDGQRPRETPGWPERAVRALLRHPIAVGTMVGVLLVLGVVTTVAWVRDPERPLRPIERELMAGRAVTLIGEKGFPAYFRIRNGDERTTVTTAADGTLSIQSWSYCLLELVPDSRHESYRFRVQVRHERSDRAGWVGVYFAHHAFPGPTKDYHLFGGMTYNDVLSAADIVNEVPRKLPPGVKIPFENHVRLGGGAAGEVRPGISWEHFPSVTSGAPFVIRQGTTEGWRELEVEVSSAAVVGTRDGQRVGTVSSANMRRSFASMVDRALEMNPGNPFLKNLDPAYSPRGGLGLIIYRGTASFRSAIVTPLSGEVQPSN